MWRRILKGDNMEWYHYLIIGYVLNFAILAWIIYDSREDGIAATAPMALVLVPFGMPALFIIGVIVLKIRGEL